ncbi:UDP-N-acetylmuramoyl-tripeptide--D-alanyl-D-alanine ligase [Asticcacaulis machinosus]|uniref:UDP-N-acetylmuramoyl-tripeptide--D-alanyl-D-alanine ligase n=1 Tax=Asticcacaulis machinosus TaxID=2984211 RepID=A0ABT5HHW8_9CAUL|nr:UDP-N-acetylmuramoyl-tripeptide--D-alanyl-D-alanine ligase [Asticcacaulis machinosus]MDC7675842.1 UDP-N-acetylmuramoyl-tripeptide--D-alanyl-D-alanine ligase [Asticcacaulis machinosus]
MTEVLWTAKEWAQAVGGALVDAAGLPLSDQAAIALHASNVNFDSRAIEAGDIFLALKGARDGHEFVASAYKAGAAFCVTERAIEGAVCCVVEDVQGALEAAAVYARDRAIGCKRGAVTGSVGKTSVTQMVMATLKRAGRAHSAIKSFNNHIGVPLTLVRMPRETERAVFEIGMNHADEITPLSQFVAPDAVIITTVGAVHTENFPDGELGIVKAKAEIFDGLQPGGLAILNADNKWFDDLKTRAEAVGVKVTSFGESVGADALLTGYDVVTGADGDYARVQAEIHGQSYDFKLYTTGKHQAVNAMSVLLMAQALGVNPKVAIAALEDFKPLAGRGSVRHVTVDGKAITVIDESYNANPISMTATIESLGARVVEPDQRKIVVLTDMLELGPDEAALHAGLFGVIEAQAIDKVYCAGPLMANLWQIVPPALRGAYAPTASELIVPLKADLRSGDVVMIKGSNGSKAGLIAASLV